MNIRLGTLFLVSLLLLPAGVRAQPAPKILVVDMTRLLNEHYSTAEQNAKLTEEQNTANTQLESIQQQINTLAEEYRALVEQAQNPVLNEQARTKASSDAQAKYAEIQAKNNEGLELRDNFTSQMQIRIQNFRDLMFDEIGQIASDLAKQKGATLLLDKSSLSALGAMSVIYSDPGYDITDEVLAQINKDRPVTPVTAPSATPPPTTGQGAAAPATPAAQ